MSAFNNGGGTLVSTTKLGAIFEIGNAIQEQESAQAVTSQLTRTSNDDGVYTFTFTNQTTKSQSGEGTLYVPENYLPAFTFNPGTGGDLSSTSLPGAFVQACELVAALEGGDAYVTTNSINTAGQQNISVTIPTQESTDPVTGGLNLQAQDLI